MARQTGTRPDLAPRIPRNQFLELASSSVLAASARSTCSSPSTLRRTRMPNSCRSLSSIAALRVLQKRKNFFREIVCSLPRRKVRRIQLDVSRIWQVGAKRASIGGRSRRIICACNHQTRSLNRREVIAQVGVTKHGAASRVASRVGSCHHFANRFHFFGVAFPVRGREPSRRSCIRNRPHPGVAQCSRSAHSTFPACRCALPYWPEPCGERGAAHESQPHADHASQRQATKIHALHVQRVQKKQHIASQLIDLVWPEWNAALAVTARVIAKDAMRSVSSPAAPYPTCADSIQASCQATALRPILSRSIRSKSAPRNSQLSASRLPQDTRNESPRAAKIITRLE